MNENPEAQHEDPTAAWHHCGAVAADVLWDTRVQLHWALQIPAAVGKQLAESQPDDSHTNPGWLEERRAFASHWSASEPYVSAAMQVGKFSILLDHDNGSESFALTGKTAAEGYQWLASQIAGIGGSLPGEWTGFDDMPAHAVRTDGAAFSPDAAALAELQGWFENADRMLHKLSSAFDYPTDTRTWPHHFDSATLIYFRAEPDPAPAKSIGIGFCPGDESRYREPYWYCTPNNVEIDESSLPELRNGGEWRTGSGRPSAVLTYGAITSAATAADQAATVQGWAESALIGCKKLLGFD